MARNKIQDLRDHLFEVIEMVKEGDMDIKTAQTIGNIGQVIVETAKAETNMLRALGLDKSFTEFIPTQQPKQIGTNGN